MIDRGYLFQPDFEVRNQIRMIGGMPDLRQFDRIFISCSGGKDSQVMSYIIAELADKQNYDKSKIELVYADTGLEWHDTYKHVQAIGAALGIKTVQVLPKYKLLDNVRRRWEMFKNGTKNAERERERIQTTSPQGRKHGKSVPESCPAILQFRPQTNTNRPVCPFPSQQIMFCRSHGKQFPMDWYIRMSGGGR